MEFNTFSILTSIIGLVVGGGAATAIFVVTRKNTDKKAENLLSEAKKEADKYKRDSLLELKEESYNSGSSQFFIMTKANTSLNGYYTAFGKVIEGMDIVNKIKQKDIMKKVTVSNEWDSSFYYFYSIY